MGDERVVITNLPNEAALTSVVYPPAPLQVMMFSATLSKEIRPVCKKFMKNPLEIYVDDEKKLTLHGLVQHYIRLPENQKNRTLHELLDALEFNQVPDAASHPKDRS